MTELIAVFLLGVVLGTVSGLIPGIHANTMAGILLSVQTVILAVFGETAMAVSLLSALIVHTFLDIVPGTFFGIPDADTALSVLPAHSLCLQGRGEEAVRISAVGSAWGAVFSLPVFALFLVILPALQPYVDWWIGIILIGVAGALIVYSESPEWSFAVFIVSGALGLFAFQHSYLAWHSLGNSSILMPLLTGLFGISVLIMSSPGEMPEQTHSGITMSRREIIKTGIAGTVAGSVVGWLPGLSNASANAVLGSLIHLEKDREGFIAATSAANTSNAFISLAALYAVSRMRNGVMAAIAESEQMPPITFLLFFGFCAAVSGFILTILFSKTGRIFAGINVRNLSYGIIAFMTILTFALTGPFGILILILASVTGIVPQIVNIRRIYCMGAVMLPVILWSFSIL
ncbi:hypothetical protein F1737_09195 [Methanoplanus sp. FWC-SCC4]|uniref:DUF112 domain-containing protein n=1 Tax=Methanochimaera problematica TaxID=2609417 RepID=A0AA97FCE6_9EURY|nr:tripartite tricarboxylate transporter permease [Methanoplanus sp. FWC-SCC4]WOF16850.1 hypothetical protein F1737_09195 [Methanoplanus sp. FWC-SCC4]